MRKPYCKYDKAAEMTVAICFGEATHRKSFSIQNQVSPYFQEFPSPSDAVRPSGNRPRQHHAARNVAVSEENNICELHIERKQRPQLSVHLFKVVKRVPGMRSPDIGLNAPHSAYRRRPSNAAIRTVVKPTYRTHAFEGQSVLVQGHQRPHQYQRRAPIQSKSHWPAVSSSISAEDHIGTSQRIEDDAERRFEGSASNNLPPENACHG